MARGPLIHSHRRPAARARTARESRAGLRPLAVGLGPLAVGLALGVAACGRFSAPDGDAELPAGGVEPGDLGSSVFEVHPSVGLVSALPDADAVTVRWRAEGFDGAAPEVAVYVGPMRSTLFDETPLRPAGGALEVTATGLDQGREYFVGLTLTDPTEGTQDRSGPVLRVVTGAPVYCDAGSTSPSPDGTTPGTAYDNLLVAVLQTFIAGGGNVWIASGVYPDLAINLPASVHLYGGFPPGFAGPRDPAAWPTRLTGLDGGASSTPFPETSPPWSRASSSTASGRRPTASRSTAARWRCAG